jgi:hypothetical protein
MEPISKKERDRMEESALYSINLSKVEDSNQFRRKDKYSKVKGTQDKDYLSVSRSSRSHRRRKRRKKDRKK